MTAGTARRLLTDFHAGLTVAENVPRDDIRLVLDVLGLVRDGSHQPEHVGSLAELADAFGTDLRIGRPMTVQAAEDVHEHSPACEVWPPHGGTWPVPEQRGSSSGTTIEATPDLEPAPSEPVEEPDTDELVDQLVEALDRADEAASDEGEIHKSDRTSAVPDQALALSREARDHAADQQLDDVERLVQRVQKYRPTDTPPRAPRGPLTVRCAACHRPIPHDPGKAAAALSEHYTTQHPGGH